MGITFIEMNKTAVKKLKWQTIRKDRAQSYGSKVVTNYDYQDRQTAGFVFLLLFMSFPRSRESKKRRESKS